MSAAECRSLPTRWGGGVFFGPTKRMGQMFLFTGNNLSLSVCICAKCGSTSLFFALYQMISGNAFPRTGPPWVHDFRDWQFANVTDSPNPGDLHLVVTRDPVDRYVSAFHSKIKCCDDNVTSCYQDRSDHLGPPLARLAGAPPRPCMSYDEYVHALTAVHRKGLQPYLNPHFKPQHLSCPIPARSPSIVVDLPLASRILSRLKGYGFHRVTIPHMHATPRGGEGLDTAPLAALSRAESQALALQGSVAASGPRQRAAQTVPHSPTM